MISPKEIINVKFKKTFRGYDELEVDSFLDRLAEDYNQVFVAYSQMELRVEELTDEVNLQREKAAAWQQAEKPAVAEITKIQQPEDSDIIIKRAKNEAEEILACAKKEAEQIIKEAEVQAREVKKDAAVEIRLLQTQHDDIKRQIKVYHSRVRSMVNAQLEMLDALLESDNER